MLMSGRWEQPQVLTSEPLFPGRIELLVVYLHYSFISLQIAESNVIEMLQTVCALTYR